ncbi:hypothetical protein ACHAXN_009850 [Cyclotella atomus]
MTIQSITSMLNDVASQLQNQHNRNSVAAVVVTAILLIVGWILSRRDKNASTKVRRKDDATKSTSNEASKPKVSEEGTLRNVFSVKQKPPVTGGGNKKDSIDRPFGSSYYYAHNNANSKGGYADGLRAEDYVMNGPKLLSKGGVRVDDERDELSNEARELDDTADVTSSDQRKKWAKIISASKQITRYLWDDDGEGDIAKIHIDCLPKTSTETMTWQEASISKDGVEVNLIGQDNDGLTIRIVSEDEKKYHLHIPKMYGSADSVKAIVKRHKLIVKITKRKIKKRQSSEGLLGSISGAFFGQTESVRSVKWPQLSSTGGEIDEKAFKEVDFKDMDNMKMFD